MQIFIDESGNFTKEAGFSVVCALTLPHKTVSKVREQLKEAATKYNWTKHKEEFKGGSFLSDHFKQLVEMLFNNSALLHCVAIGITKEDEQDILKHQNNQCEGLTKYLGPNHLSSFKEDILSLRATLKNMSPQLYIQSVLMTELVWKTFQESLIYFVQRRPYELGDFSWFVDAKHPRTTTEYENWWKNTLAPFLESKSRELPLKLVAGFNYKHFKRNYSGSKNMWFPGRPREMVKGHDLKKIFTNKISFIDSRDEILIQVADIFSNFIRRALKGEIKDQNIIRWLGKLSIPENRGGLLTPIQMVHLVPRKLLSVEVVNLLLLMTSEGRQMFK